MNIIDSSYAAEGQPFRSPTSLDHLQNGIKEIAAQPLISTIGPAYDATKVYILWGIVEGSGPFGSITYSAGAVFYNGEIFYHPGSTIPLIGIGQTAVCALNITFPITDPTVMDIGTSRSIHQIRRARILAATPGSGMGDYANLIRMQDWQDGGAITITAVSGSITVDPGDVKYNKYKIVGKTLHYSLQISGATTAGIAAFYVDLPFVANAWPNANMQFPGIYNAKNQLIVGLVASTPGRLVVYRSTASGATPYDNGTNDQEFHVNIVTEIA